MNAGEKFEKECLDYLKKTYENKNVKFESAGGMDSTLSDIEVKKNNARDFFIEVKMANAQSGQFVVISDDKTKQFVFSPRNKSKQNDMTDIIIDYMNSDYEKFTNAGTAGSNIDIDSSIFEKWIIQHYKDRNVKYCISGENNYVIFPIEKYGEYFNISATYRIKKSGSSRPAKTLIPTIYSEISKTYIAKYERDEKGSLFARIYEEVEEDKFPLGEYMYFLAPRTENYYEVRKLSNTRNMNVIFSVKLKKKQDPNDLLQFEKDISS